MSYNSSSYETESEEEDHVQCNYCNNWMPPSSIEGHIDRKHPEHSKRMCGYCSHVMPQSSLQGHIERKHPIQCSYCSKWFTPNTLNSHIEGQHKHLQMAGLVHGSAFNDQQFNNLVQNNKIFAKNGIIYTVTYK